MRMRWMLSATAIILASCSTGDSAVPGVDGSPDLAASTAPSTVDPAISTAPPADSSAATTTPPPPEPTTVAADTVTTAHETSADETLADTVSAACAALRNNGYESRKRARALLPDDAVSAVAADCPTALDQLDAAIVIEERMAAFNADTAPLAATDLVCDAGDFSLTITNQIDHPIGVHASMRLAADGVDGSLGSTLQPLVIWALDPGATALLNGTYEVNRPTDAALTCEVSITAFDATPGDADASIGATLVAELAVDDPAQWLPFLVAQGDAIVGSGDPDLAAVVEDVRSTEYPQVLGRTAVGVDDAATSGTISVCTASIARPDERHVSLVYFDERPDGSVLQHGLFRRGNDNQWRWLSSSVAFDSQDYWDCGTPSINQ